MTRTTIAAALVAVLLPLSARAQQRPLVTQDPETIGAGRILVEGGLDYGTDVFFPASGLTGNLFRAPLLGAMFGISSIAEVQVTGGLHDRLAITGRVPAPLSSLLDVTGDTTGDVEDIVFATKIKLLGETESRPAFGLRFATRLPNASNESGLGTDTFDFYVSALGGKTVRSIRVVANLGVGILGDPTSGSNQNDVITYGLSLARAMTNEVELVGELNGRANTRDAPPPGTETRGVLRFGARYTRGPVRFDAAGLLGLTERDPGVGLALGVTYIFNAFEVK